jgi:site-specific DNA-methyltransferase (adenine-specific)
MDFVGLNIKQINNTLGHRRAEHTFYINSSQYGLCTEKTYDELVSIFSINEMGGFKDFTCLKNIDDKFKNDLPSTFNLWEGKKYKSNIFKYDRSDVGHHPTQKPILLLEDIIKTFSNEGDLVVDLTMGSGSTGVACVNTKRDFTGIEMGEEYFNISVDRIKKAIGDSKCI